jgi:hypothetical protein
VCPDRCGYVTAPVCKLGKAAGSCPDCDWYGECAGTADHYIQSLDDRCPHCGAATPNKTHCMSCGKVIK